MSPHLSAKLLKPASPLLSAESSDDEEMVYSPYVRPGHPHACRKPRRRSHQMSAEVRAEIVARVLDPAYSGRRESSARVFIDPNGDAHDPDYQLFPTYPRKSSQTTHATSPRGFFRRMPSDDDLSREDEESEAEWARVRTASPYTSGASTSSTSPQPQEMSLFGDDEWDEKEWTREVVVPVAAPKRRKHSKASSTSSFPETPRTVYVPVTPVIVEPAAAMEDDEHDSPAIAYSRHSAVELVREDTMDTAADDTPSCGYILRRQWATFALHTRLSAHRIARRARRAVSVGT